MRVASRRTRTRWRYAALRASAESFGSTLESYVPSRSMIRRMSSAAIPSAPRGSATVPNHLLHEEFTGAVRGPNERARGHVQAPQRLSRLAKRVERLPRDGLP